MKKAILFQGLFTLSLFILFGSQCFALTSEEKDIYSSTVERILHEPYGEYATYAQVDLNNDEVSELIVSHLSDDEISTIDEVFTINNGSCISVGFLYGPNSYYETESGEGVYAVNAYQGYGTKDVVHMIDNKISINTELEGEIVDWSDFTNDSPIYQNKLVNFHNEQIIPGSDARFLTDEDIQFLNDTGLELAKNEIYARHGYIFEKPYIDKYFMMQSWYTPSVSAEEFSDSVLNEYEAVNITLLANKEEKSQESSLEEEQDDELADVTGIYDASKCEKDGESYQCDREYLSLNEDGSGEVQFNGKVYSLTWNLDGTSLSFTDEDGDTAFGTLEDDTIHIKYIDFQYEYIKNHNNLGSYDDSAEDTLNNELMEEEQEGKFQLTNSELTELPLFYYGVGLIHPDYFQSDFENTSGDYIYTMKEDGTAEIIRYIGNDYLLTVPNELDGYKVTSIGAGAFNKMFLGTFTITLPANIEEIKSNPFPGNTVIFAPNNPYFYVNEGVLFSRSDNRLIYFPNAKEEYAVPEGIQIIGGGAFYHCDKLRSISLPDSLTSIEDWAFSNCSGLNSITLPESIEMMGANPFCGDTINISISSDHPYLAKIDGVLFSKPDKRLIYFQDIKKDYTVPEGIQIIGGGAFFNCDNLFSITLPDSLDRIGGWAFYDCKFLDSITLPDGLTSIGSFSFSRCIKLSSITLPDSLTSIGDGAFYGSSDDFFCLFYSIELPDSLTYIGRYAFYYCTHLESVTMPDSLALTSIGDNTFSDCSNLSSINLPDGLTSIGDRAFSNCSSLSSINLPDSLTSIGDEAFSYCRKLSIIINHNTYAEEYCNNNYLNYTSSYSDANDWLNN